MKKIWVGLLSLVLPNILEAQEIETIIQGKLKDASTNETIINATIKLIRTKDSAIIKKTISNNDGFIITKIPADNYKLQFSHIGYRDTSYTVNIIAKDSLYNTGVLTISRRVDELKEVTIEAQIPPVVFKNDTLTFNVGAFPTKPNATVQELLKKLPGFEIDNAGNLLFQGNKIKSIYIDGKELILNDPKIVTQNFLADMLQKVEVIESKSQRFKLTGIPDAQIDKALNLKLKPEKKKGHFGVTETSYANKNNYNISPSINFLDKNAFAILGVGIDNTGSTLAHNQSKQASANYQNLILSNLQFNISYNYNSNNSNTWYYNHRHTFIADSSLIQVREGTTTTKNNNHNTNINLRYTINQFSTLDVSAAFGWQSTNNNTMDTAYSQIIKTDITKLVNNAWAFNQNNSNTWNGNINFNFSHRFKKTGRSLVMHANTLMNQQKGTTGIFSTTIFNNQNNIPNDSQQRDSHLNEYLKGSLLDAGITYTEPLGKNRVVDCYYNFNTLNNQNYRQAYNYNPFTSKYDITDTITSSSFNNYRGDHNWGIGYNDFKNSKYNYEIGIGFSINEQINSNKIVSGKDFEQKAINIFPRASLTYTLNKQRNIRLTYNGNNRQPTINQIQSVPDLSNPLLIHLVNPSLKPEFNNEISAEYKHFQANKFRNFVLQINYRNTMNRIVNSITTNAQGIQEQQYVNLKWDYGIGGAISYEQPLIKPPKPFDIRHNSFLNVYRDANLINTELNKRISFILGQRVALNYHFKEKLFASLTANFNLSCIQYSVQNSGSNTFISHQYSGSFYYELPRQWIVYTDFNLFFNYSTQKTKAPNAIVWNASVSKKLFINKKGELKLSSMDILNNRKNVSQNTGDNYIEIAQTAVVNRIFTLSFTYRFANYKP